MDSRNIIWTPVVRKKLTGFRNENFTVAETLKHISQIISETENLLKNPIIGTEFGVYKGISRVVIRKFKIYYKQINNDIVVIGILYPGEN